VKRLYFPEEWQILQEQYCRGNGARKGWKDYGVFEDEETVPLTIGESERTASGHQWA
jgi:hypothetical protein